MQVQILPSAPRKGNEMQMILRYEGGLYFSKKTYEVSKYEAAEEFYEKSIQFDNLKMDLEDGGILVLGKEAIRRSTFEFID